MGRGGGCKTIALGSVFSLSGALTPVRVVTLGFSESIWITKLFKSYWYKQGKAPEVTSGPPLAPGGSVGWSRRHQSTIGWRITSLLCVLRRTYLLLTFLHTKHLYGFS